MTMSQPELSRWNWPPFLLYCFVFFFVALLLGTWGLPGIGVALPGVAIGILAAWGQWFEAKVHPWEVRREQSLSHENKPRDDARDGNDG
jgi:hypothetical protein